MSDAARLNWLVNAPALLSCAPFHDAGLWLQREQAQDTHWLGRAAERLRAQEAPRRLGLAFEQWVAALLDSSQALKRHASNLPLRHDGHTLGELDLIVEDLTTNECWHWELAVKFYLATEQGWLGPNRQDSLARKTQHLFTQQLPRSHTPLAKDILKQQNITLTGQALLTRGRLFYPRHNTFPLPEAPLLDAHHERGWWCHTSELPPSRWRIIMREHWPCPTMSDKSINWIDSPQLISYVEHHSRPAMVVAESDPQPGFVVPANWSTTES